MNRIGLPVTVIYLGLFTLIEITSLLLLANLNTGFILHALIQYAVPLSVFLLAVNLFLGLGLWLCGIDLMQQKRNPRGLMHLPLFKVAALSLLPALGLLTILLLFGPFGFFMGFLWIEIVGIFFLSAVLSVFRKRSLGADLWAISKPVYVTHRASILGIAVCLAIGQVGFISLVSEEDLDTILGFTLLFSPLLLIHFHFLFRSIRLSFDGLRTTETVKAASEQASEQASPHGILSPVVIVSVILGILFLSVNAFQQSVLDAHFRGFNERIVTQQAKNRYQRPVLRGKALAGNGDKAYWEIIGKADSPQTEENQAYVAPVSFLQKNYPDLELALRKDREAFKTDRGIQSQPALSSKYRPVIQALQTAAAHEYIQHDYAYDINATLPNFINAQDLAAIMTSLAMTQCESGHCLAGGELFMDTLRLGQDIEYRGTLIDGMVGIVIKNKAIRAGLSQLNHRQLNAQELNILTSRMETLLHSEKNLQQAIANEFLFLEKIMHDLNQKPHKGPTLLAELSTSSDSYKSPLFSRLFSPLFFNPLFRPVMLDALKKLGPIRVKYESIYLLPRSQQKEAMETFNADLEHTLENNFILGVAMPNFTGAWEREMNAQLHINAAYLYLALETYRAKKGNYPERLETLVPEIIPQLPLDPWTNQAFKYKRLTSEYFAFYSFGEKGKLDKTTAYFDPSKQHCKNESTLIFSNQFAAPSAHHQTTLSPCENDTHFITKE